MTERVLAGPPAYAWAWFARQRLMWREVSARLGRLAEFESRYPISASRDDVLAQLRADYRRHEGVREVVVQVVTEFGFLGRIDGPFAVLGISSPPRGMQWWWTTITGERVEPRAKPTPKAAEQLTLRDVQEGYGG